MDEELEEILNADDGAEIIEREDEHWMERGKKKLAVFLKQYAFITVLAMASVS